MEGNGVSISILGLDVGSTQICAVSAECDETRNLKITGIGRSKSQGLKKGNVKNIELASKSIRQAVDEVKMMSGINKYDKVVVSISGAAIMSTESSGVITIPNNNPKREINVFEIKRVMQSAEYNADIKTEYEKLHILPYNFKVESQDNVEDPLGMSCDRLQVFAHLILVQKSILITLKKTLEEAGVTPTDIVFSGYASSIATLNDDEKELGAVVIDMGGDTCNMVVHSGNSIRYNDFLAIGSSNITLDLSTALHTPTSAAEKIKIECSSIKDSEQDVIEYPEMGEENSTKDVSIGIVQNIIYARVHETLSILANMLEKSGFMKYVNAGVILTGGMAKLHSIDTLASAIFDNTQVRIAKPKKILGLADTDRESDMSCAIGLCMYGAGYFVPYEIDSSGEMKLKDSNFNKSINFSNDKQTHISNDSTTDIEDKLDQIDNINFSYNDLKMGTDNRDFDDVSSDNSRWKNLWFKIKELF